MNTSKRIKVPGYAQKIRYENGIEYRNFTTDIVSPQLSDSKSGSVPSFTMGSFVINTNLDNLVKDKTYPTNSFSDFFTLETINPNDFTVNQNSNNNLSGTTKIILNYDKTNLENYVYFTSLTDFIKVNFSNIINTWPASLYINPNSLTTIGKYPTVEDYSYDNINNTSYFKINVNRITNNFNLKYDEKTYDDSFKNLLVNYDKYVIYNISGSTENKILEFSGSTNYYNGYCHFKTEGNPFPDAEINQYSYSIFHVKPNSDKIEEFFTNLSDFGKHILNRKTNPKYTSYFTIKEEDENGGVIINDVVFKWPVRDGYNIDYNTTDYNNYLQKFLTIATNYDTYNTDIVYRLLTSQNLKEYDTEDKVLESVVKSWGSVFDEIKLYSDNISNAWNVTYDKKNNLGDKLIKNFSKTLGWESQNIIETGNVNDVIKRTEPIYSGHSIGYSNEETEIELWRRLVINSPYIFKSKGTRQPIDFFKKFFSIPDDLLRFNEHVYVASNPLNIDEVLSLNQEINGDSTTTNLAIDEQGYPKPLNNDEYYFQCGGGWYRKTGGSNLDVSKNYGNNPHGGNYDGGKKYWKQFTELIPNFTIGVTEEEKTIVKSINHYNNFNSGSFDGYDNKIINSGTTNILIPIYSGSQITSTIISIIDDPLDRYNETSCECLEPKSIKLNPRQLFYNDEISSGFTKNDCPNTFSGTVVTYTVSGNTYYGLTKQEANDLALLDIITNGQNYANNNGSCDLFKYPTYLFNKEENKDETYLFNKVENKDETYLFNNIEE